MATYTTSVMGWTPGADVSSSLTTFLNTTYVSGDTLQVDDFYELSAEFNLPANITIQGMANGDGFNVSSSMTDDVLFYGADGVNNVTIINLTLTADEAPVWATVNEKSAPGTPTDYQDFSYFEVHDCSGWYWLNCDFQNQVLAAVDFRHTNAPFMEYCRFYRPVFGLSIQGNTRNFRFWNCFFEECISESVKTSPIGGSDYGPSSDGVIDNFKDCTFKRVNRSHYDTTGGFRDIRLVRDRAYAGSEMYDIKAVYNNDGDESLNRLLRGITIDDPLWVANTGQFIVTTLLQKAETNWMTAAEWSTYGPRDITVNNAICECSSSPQNGTKHLLNKAGINIVFNGIVRRGYTGSLPSNERDLWNERVGLGGDGDAPTGWTPDQAPTDGGDSGYAVFNDVTEAAWPDLDPVNDWHWTRKPTSTNRIATLGGSTGLFLGGAPLII